MRFHPFLAGTLLCCAPLFSAATEDKPSAPPDQAGGLARHLNEVAYNPSAEKDSSTDPVLPLKIPGYELRVLDVSKPVLFSVNGNWVQASLPIFFYFPTTPPAPAIPLLRHAYDDLLKLGRQPEWTAADLQAVIVNLDTAIRLLEQSAPSPKPKT